LLLSVLAESKAAMMELDILENVINQPLTAAITSLFAKIQMSREHMCTGIMSIEAFPASINPS
jgi:hypothetical protein